MREKAKERGAENREEKTERAESPNESESLS